MKSIDIDLAGKLGKILAGRKVCIVGVGNPLKGDDGVGPAIVRQLQNSPDCICIDAGASPENSLETVVATQAQSVLFVDAGFFDAPAGAVRLISPRDAAVLGLTTHGISLGILGEYLSNRAPLAVTILAVRHGGCTEGNTLSAAVARTAEQLAHVFQTSVCARASIPAAPSEEGRRSYHSASVA